jgi:Cu(I)/Ag(I) efflux system membrane fusion protein
MSKRGVLTAVVALGLGAGGGYWLAQQPVPDLRPLMETKAAAYLLETEAGQWLAERLGPILGEAEPAPPAKAERRPLFYRNPMNPAITSPLPAKDEMGMDYVPVYAEEPKAERRPLFYRNPMNPAITSPLPAKDEMGMAYIPVYADDEVADEPSGTVAIDPVTVQSIGVRTAAAERRGLSHTIHTLGRVDYDEERLTRLHPKTEGWIDELFVNRTGQSVERDTILLSIYSPQLVSSQQEYLLALKNLQALELSPHPDISRGAEDLVGLTRERLELLDVPEHQLRELEETKKIKKNLHIHSPFTGVVLAVGAREGQYVTPRTELYQIADLSRVWVYVDVYENEIPWVKVADRAEMRVESLPGRIFEGTMSYVYPYLERKTRTVKVRLEFDNSDLALKPDMFANVTLFPARRVDAVVIPEEAVLRSGTRKRVFVVRAPGKFEPREVTLGVAAEGLVQVLDGVAEGEEVVTSAQFLIDSESKLREATAKMMEALKPVADSPQTAPDEGAMEGMAPGMAPDQGAMEGMTHDEGGMEGMTHGEGAMEGMKHDEGDMEGMTPGEGGMEGMTHGEGAMEGMTHGEGAMEGMTHGEGAMEGMAPGMAPEHDGPAADRP